MNQRTKIYLVYVFLFIISLVFFWLVLSPSDAFGYSLIFMIVLNPSVIFLSNLYIGLKTKRRKLDYVIPIGYGISYMLLGYLTFSLANMLANGKVNFPNLELFIIGTLLSYGGLFIGTGLKKLFGNLNRFYTGAKIQ